MKVKMCDLLNIVQPRTRIRLHVKILNDSFTFEASLTDFKKSRYYQIFWDKKVDFEIFGGIPVFILDITVDGGLEDDI